MTIPLGQAESDVLEFKGRDALEERHGIVREVVAFLNAGGGALYVGVREENERAVEVEPIENAPEELRKLQDSLIDKIEPKPSPGEVELEVVADERGREVLLVRVRRGEHGPYALLGKKEARRYLVRIGSRLRAMSREELAKAFSRQEQQEDRLRSTREDLRAERDALQQEGEDRVWCALQPVRELDLHLQDHEERWRTLLSDPEAIGHARGTPSFHVPFEPEVRQDRRVVRVRLPGFDDDVDRRVKETTLWKHGGIRFDATFHLLYQHARGSTPRLINPEVLIGVPLSLLRLAAAALEGHLAEDDEVVADLALLGAGREEAVLLPGRGLRPAAHGVREKVGSYEDGDDLVLTNPPIFTFEEIRNAPERSVFRLLSPIYEAFGLRTDLLLI